jgi:hypothetical protein
MSFLIYVNELGPNYRGDNIYEFIFSDSLSDVWGELWESKPSNGYPHPPNIEFVKKVGVLKNDKISLSVIQKSDYFSMIDAVDDVVALAWENENESINFDLVKRLVFRFGDTEENLKNKLYERDIVLEFEKKFHYES